jgi:Poly(R)-hydroxyalkanoic acid synthase subunit (PHA_synth_III_E)
MSESFKLPSGWDPFGTSQQLGALAAASIDMVAAWSKAWQAVVEQRGEPALRAMLDPAAWATDGEHDPEAVLERWLGVPRFADLLVDPEALKRGLPAVELAQVASAYAQAALRVWSEVAQRFQQQLAAAETGPEGPGEALDLWNASVDETLMRFHRSEPFADLQRRFLRAAMRYRQEQRRIVERAAELYDLPTRSEIDALARRVHALERENRALKRRVEAAQRPHGSKA